MTQKEFEADVLHYCRLQQELKSLKDEEEALKKRLTEYMIENNIATQEVEGFKLTRRYSERTKVDSDKLLAIVRSWGSVSDELIKTAEYVDGDKLESAVYQGKIDREKVMELDKCRTVTAIHSLLWKET